MPASIPPVLAPYLQSCLQQGSASLITSVLDTPAHWLTLRFIKAAVFGVDDDTNVGQISPGVSATRRSNSSVVFVSFLRSYEFWIEIGKKLGLDLATLVTWKRLVYVDGLNVDYNIPQQSSTTMKVRTHSLLDINNAITTAASFLSEKGDASNQATLVIDGLDFVLASDSEMSASHLSAFLTELRNSFTSLVLTASADTPLLHNSEASATPLELEHSIFVRTAAHKSSWVLQLRPLETGHAKDVTGVIQISRGGAEEVEDTAMLDCEWLYRIKGDESVTVWSRGE